MDRNSFKQDGQPRHMLKRFLQAREKGIRKSHLIPKTGPKLQLKHGTILRPITVASNKSLLVLNEIYEHHTIHLPGVGIKNPPLTLFGKLLNEGLITEIAELPIGSQ